MPNCLHIPLLCEHDCEYKTPYMHSCQLARGGEGNAGELGLQDLGAEATAEVIRTVLKKRAALRRVLPRRSPFRLTLPRSWFRK